jgi:hypothetical protein
MSGAPSSVFTFAAGLWAFVGTAPAQTPGPGVVPFIVINEPVLVLRHVRVIDGTGSAARDPRRV